jgi:hypothetical protein
MSSGPNLDAAIRPAIHSRTELASHQHQRGQSSSDEDASHSVALVGVEPCAERPEGSVIRWPLKPGEAEGGSQKVAALVEHGLFESCVKAHDGLQSAAYTPIHFAKRRSQRVRRPLPSFSAPLRYYGQSWRNAEYSLVVCSAELSNFGAKWRGNLIVHVYVEAGLSSHERTFAADNEIVLESIEWRLRSR